MTTRTYLAAAFLLLAPLVASAQSADWPAVVVCSLGDATLCTPEGCRQVPLDDLDVPRMIRLDFKEGVMHAVTPEQAGRRSTFKVIEAGEAKLVLQGYENGRAFSAVLSEPGTLALGASMDNATASLFGRCTDLKLITEAGK